MRLIITAFHSFLFRMIQWLQKRGRSRLSNCSLFRVGKLINHSGWQEKSEIDCGKMFWLCWTSCVEFFCWVLRFKKYDLESSKKMRPPYKCDPPFRTMFSLWILKIFQVSSIFWWLLMFYKKTVILISFHHFLFSGVFLFFRFNFWFSGFSPKSRNNHLILWKYKNFNFKAA